MRKLMIVAVMLSVLGISSALAVSNQATNPPASLQIAGDEGPGGG